ncbi:hypothetical protein LWI28_011055 [Acer negundo]|uniref:Uncharacterized protein n=1 Tax=Acer negundo TaxID=4023 RepID=A0AAD5I957_ACENE|nr:hypothetical protein LWI28_011055 [Acer negundo]
MALVSLLDFSKVVNDAHPSLGDPTIGLVSILKMRWNQVETSIEERQKLIGVTCLISSSVDEVTGQGSLALDVIEQSSPPTTTTTTTSTVVAASKYIDISIIHSTSAFPRLRV